MPNTGNAGMAAFDRDFYSQLDKAGLVLDERFNGGGKVADYVIRSAVAQDALLLDESRAVVGAGRRSGRSKAPR